MVLMLDGNSEYVAHVWKKDRFFSRENLEFVCFFLYKQMTNDLFLNYRLIYVPWTILHFLWEPNGSSFRQGFGSGGCRSGNTPDLYPSLEKDPDPDATLRVRPPSIYQIRIRYPRKNGSVRQEKPDPYKIHHWIKIFILNYDFGEWILKEKSDFRLTLNRDVEKNLVNSS